MDITRGPALAPILVLRIDRAYRQLKRYLGVWEGYRRDSIKPPPEHYEEHGSLQDMFIISLMYTLRSIGYKADLYALDEIGCSDRLGVGLKDGCHITIWDGSEGYSLRCQYRVALYTPYDYDGTKAANSPVPATYKGAGVTVDSIEEVLEHLHVIATTIESDDRSDDLRTTN